ncbi:NAD-dependent epimerase/dehydratase family protein [Streptomyces sp. NPDC058272]
MVAGATGVVGRALVPLLTSVGHVVVALARTPGRRPPA